MRELVVANQLPIIPEHWDYQESVSKTKPLVYRWKTLTIELATDLYVARRKLSHEGKPVLTGAKAPVTWNDYCEDIGLDKRLANKWLVSIFGPQRLAHVSYNTGEQEWYTPKKYIELARKVLGQIDLDPASTEEANKLIQATRYYSKDEDGLTQEWHGHIWMNPPYAQPLIDQFCNKLIEEYDNQHITDAVILVNNATDTRWFHKLCTKASALCFPLGRVHFWSPSNGMAGPLQGQVLIYIGDNIPLFAGTFSTLGLIVEVRCNSVKH